MGPLCFGYNATAARGRLAEMECAVVFEHRSAFFLTESEMSMEGRVTKRL